jgi:hypothetical protein
LDRGTAGREGQAVLNKLINATRRRKRTAQRAMLLALGAALLAPAMASAVPPSRQLDVHAVTGCCACRGTKDGEKTSLKSCSDGLTVDACQAKCDVENAGSLVFGYQQTCSQGCAGFATQSLQ